MKLCLALFLISAACAQDYDLLLKGGQVIDGKNKINAVRDVAIKDGHFVRIGKVDGKGKREIDATGRYVSPGWIGP